MRLLVVVAVPAERDAVLRGAPWLRGVPGPGVLVAGIGSVAAAARTTAALGGRSATSYHAVANLGVAGGYAGEAEVGSTVLASRSVAADLGVEFSRGVEPLEDTTTAYDVDATFANRLCRALDAPVVGSVLTVSTVTASDARADALRARFPDAVAEAMEGFGVAAAAALYGIPFLELRTVSNLVGRRDLSSWRIGTALDTLAGAAATLAEALR